MSFFTILTFKFKPAKLLAAMAGCSLFAGIASADVFISELHYDNAGTDVGEAIKISGPAGTDVTGWQLALYNGSGGAVYNTLPVSGFLVAGEGCELGQWLVELPSNGLQNGSPDGIALIDNLGSVIEFMSYEGELTATDGPAAGLTSVDIGVSETGTTPEGYSLQKINGQWLAPAMNTFNACTTISEPEPELQTVKIHEIQGAGDAVALTGLVQVDAIVTADFLGAQKLNGFFIQEEDSDNDNNAQTSEGIFVYCPSCSDIALGDLVTVTGTAAEFNGMSQITASNVVVISHNNALPNTRVLQMPLAAITADQINSAYEAYEGMLVTVANELTVTETYNLGRYGEIVLSAEGRLRQFTDANSPTEEGFIAHQIANARRSLILDDGSSKQNLSPVVYPTPYLSQQNFVRGGDTLSQLSGVLHFAFSKWRIQPVAAFEYSFVANNPRPLLPPQINAPLKIASFNVLNYFTSLDVGVPVCGPMQTMDCRGANSHEELDRQQAKIVSAICLLDADIVGLMEIQNSSANEISALATLTSAVNSQCGGYTAVMTGPIGSDAITVAMIYRAATVTPIGNTAILDSQEFVNPMASSVDKNRPALAQSFIDRATKTAFTVVVNHLKSKGSSCNDAQHSDDDDTTRGQGNCNGTRTQAVAAELQWLTTQPTGVDTDKILVIGDLNAYRNEAPISAFKHAGFSDMVDYFGGDEAYSYVFNGEWGYLDHALASDALVPAVVNTHHWAINADEIPLFDYNDEYKPDNFLTELFAPNPFRSSDHDAVIVGLLFETPKTNLTDIAAYFNAALLRGEINGAGRFSIIRYLNELTFYLALQSANKLADKNPRASCAIVKDLIDLTDGKSHPQDNILGQGVVALNGLLKNYWQTNCENLTPKKPHK